jgi:hypothetical protein
MKSLYTSRRKKILLQLIKKVLENLRKFRSDFRKSQNSQFLISTHEKWKILVSLGFYCIANFHVLGLLIPKKGIYSDFFSAVTRRCRPVEICIDDISAVLGATDLIFFVKMLDGSNFGKSCLLQ